MLFAIISKCLTCILLGGVFGVNSQSPYGFWGFEDWRHFFGLMAPSNMRSSAALPRRMSDIQLPAHIPPHIADALNRLKQEISSGIQDDNDEHINDFSPSRPKFGMNQFPINRFIGDTEVASANPMSIPPVKLYQQNNVLVNIERIIKRNSYNSRKKQAQKYLSEHYLSKPISSQKTTHKTEVPTVEYPSINTVAELPDHFKAVYKDILNKAIKDSTIFKTPHSESNVYKNALTPQLFTKEILFRDVQAKSEDTTQKLLNPISDDDEEKILGNGYNVHYTGFKTFTDNPSFEYTTANNFMNNENSFKENRDNSDEIKSEIKLFSKIKTYKNQSPHNDTSNNIINTPKADGTESLMTTPVKNLNTSSYGDVNLKTNRSVTDYSTPFFYVNVSSIANNDILIKVEKPNTALHQDIKPENALPLLTSNEFKNIMYQGVDNMRDEIKTFAVKENMSNDGEIKNQHNFNINNQIKVINYIEEKEDSSTNNFEIEALTTTLSTPLLSSEEFKNIMFKGVENTSHQYDLKQNISQDDKINDPKEHTPNKEIIVPSQMNEEKDKLSVDILKNLTSINDTLNQTDTVKSNSKMQETAKEARLLIDLLTGKIHDDITNEFGDSFNEENNVPKLAVPQVSNVYKLVQDIPDIATNSDQFELNDKISPETIHILLASYNVNASEANPDTDLYENIDFRDFLENDLILKQTNNISKHETNFRPFTVSTNNDKDQYEHETNPMTTIRSSNLEDMFIRQIEIPLSKDKDQALPQTTLENIDEDLVFDTYYKDIETLLSRSNDIDSLETTFSNFEYTTPPISTNQLNRSNEMILIDRKDSATDSENSGDASVTESPKTSSVTTDFGYKSAIETTITIPNDNKSSKGSVASKYDKVTKNLNTLQPSLESYITKDKITEIVEATTESESDHIVGQENLSKVVNIEEERSLLQLNNEYPSTPTEEILYDEHTVKLIIPDYDTDKTEDERSDFIKKPNNVQMDESSYLDSLNLVNRIKQTNLSRAVDIEKEKMLDDEHTVESIILKYDTYRSNKTDISSKQILDVINKTNYVIERNEMTDLEKSSTEKSYAIPVVDTTRTMIYQNIADIFLPETTEYSTPTERENKINITIQDNNMHRNLIELLNLSKAELLPTTEVEYPTPFPYTKMIMDTTSVTEAIIPDVEYKVHPATAHTTPIISENDDEPSIASNSKKYDTLVPYAEITSIIDPLLYESREYSAIDDTLLQTSDHNDLMSIKANASNDDRNLTKLMDIPNLNETPFLLSKAELLPTTDTANTTYIPYTKIIMDTKSVAETIIPETAYRVYTATAYTTPVISDNEDESSTTSNSKEYTTFIPYAETTTSVTNSLLYESRENSAINDILLQKTGDKDMSIIATERNLKKNMDVPPLLNVSKTELSSTTNTADTIYFPYTEMIMDTKSVTEAYFPSTSYGVHPATTYTTPVTSDNKDESNITLNSKEYTTFIPYAETTTSVMDSLLYESRENSAINDILLQKTGDKDMSIIATDRNLKKYMNVPPLLNVSKTELSSTTNTADTIYFPYTEMIMDTKSVTEAYFPSTSYGVHPATTYNTPVTSDNKDESNITLNSKEYTTFIPFAETTTSATDPLLYESREYSEIYDTNVMVNSNNDDRNLTKLTDNVDVSPTGRSYTSVYNRSIDTENTTDTFFSEVREYSTMIDTTEIEHKDEKRIQINNYNEKKNLIQLPDISLSSTNLRNTSRQVLAERGKDQDEEVNVDRSKIDPNSIFTTEQINFYESSDVIDTSDMYNSNDNPDPSVTVILDTSYTISPVTEHL